MNAEPDRLIVFDLDGVLIDSRKVHFDALNFALTVFSPQNTIPESEHVRVFEGLDTRSKLKYLSEHNGLDPKLHNSIWQKKQEITEKLLGQQAPSPELRRLLETLRADGFAIAVASNSIRSTVDSVLERLGLRQLVDLVLSNEDVVSPKPYPEIYWKAMAFFGVDPRKTWIVEDSRAGREAAQLSGANLIPVNSYSEVNLPTIQRGTAQNMRNPVVWNAPNLNVVIPMAGAGSRFEAAGYTFPKPLIEVRGRPMIEAVVENLNISAQFTFIVQESHFNKYNLETVLNLIAPGCNIVRVEGVTDGAARTVLKAREHFDSEQELLLANSDQFIEWNSSATMYEFLSRDADGGVVTFHASHPKWSFVATDSSGWVQEVAEKRPISERATVGVYYWRRGSDFVKYAEQMIQADERTNGEFYVAPVFNRAIKDKKRIWAVDIEKMWGLGTPEDLDYFHSFGPRI